MTETAITRLTKEIADKIFVDGADHLSLNKHRNYIGLGWGKGPLTEALNRLLHERLGDRRAADADLLEACRKTLFFFNSLRAANDDPLRAIQDRIHGPIREMLAAAIAKAEGRDV